MNAGATALIGLPSYAYVCMHPHTITYAKNHTGITDAFFLKSRSAIFYVYVLVYFSLMILC